MSLFQMRYVLATIMLGSFIGLNAAADVPTASLPLTKSVSVVEGAKTNSYFGNQFGQVLYTFDLDAANKSACDSKCAEQWPPYVITTAEAQNLAAPFGTVTRSSGLLQLTIDGKPVYTYFENRVEGDDKGDGVGGVWHDIDFK